jgi:hypothetical protein
MPRSRFRFVRATRLAALAAVVGPGVLAGLSDDDPGGITTYSILGADHGYRLLWVLAVSTAALVLYHELGARMGCVTGQGLAGLVRARYGVRWAALGLVWLVAANVGVPAPSSRASRPRWASPGSAATSAYRSRWPGSRPSCCAAASTAWSTSCSSSAPCSSRTSAPGCSPVPTGRPWHLASRCRAWRSIATRSSSWPPPSARPSRPGALRSSSPTRSTTGSWRDVALERVDVVTRAVMTGVIGLFIVVACASMLHAQGARDCGRRRRREGTRSARRRPRLDAVRRRPARRSAPGGVDPAAVDGLLGLGGGGGRGQTGRPLARGPGVPRHLCAGRGRRGRRRTGPGRAPGPDPRHDAGPSTRCCCFRCSCSSGPWPATGS